MKRKTVLLLTLLAGFAGSVTPSFSKVALESMSPGTLTILRYVYTFGVVWLLVRLQRERTDWRHVVHVLPVSVFAAINAICFLIGIQYVQAAVSQLLVTIIPLLVAILSWAFLKQRTSFGKAFGLVIGLLGVVIVTAASLLSHNQRIAFEPRGVFIGCLAFSLYTVLSKPAQDKATPADMLLAVSIATIVCQLGFSIISKSSLDLGHITLRSLLSSLIVGVIGTALYYWLYQYIVKKGSPLLASVIIFVLPFSGSLVAFIMLHERLSLLEVAGGLLALIGVGQVNGLWQTAIKNLRQKRTRAAAS